MPNPIMSQVHTDTPLDNFSLAYLQAQEDYKGRQVAPITKVGKQSAKYHIYTKGDFFKDEAQRRAPGTDFHEVGFRLSTDTYFCEQYDAAFPVPDEDKANADPDIDLVKDGVELVTQKLLLKHEVLMAAKAFATSVWTPTDQTGVSSAPSTDQFLQFDQGGSKPFETIRGRLKKLRTNCGRRGNFVAIAEDVWDVLADHADLVDRVKHTSADAVTPDLLARLLGVRQVVIVGAVKNTALESATASLSAIAAGKIFVAYQDPVPSLRSMSALKTFCWMPDAGYQPTTGFRLRQMREDNKDREVVKGDIHLDVKVTAADAGCILTSCIA